MPTNTYDESHAVDYLDAQRIELAKLRAAKIGSSVLVPSYILTLDETMNISDSLAAPISKTPGNFMITGDKTNQKLMLLFDRDLLDGSDNANNGTIVGTEAYVAGPEISPDKLDTAHDFNGSSQVDIPNESNFDRERTDTFSISFWAKWTSATAMVIISKMTAVASIGYVIETKSDGKLRIRLINTATTNEIDVETPLTYKDGRWRHFVFTKGTGSNAVACKLYVNGVAVTLTVVTDNLTATILNNIAVSIGGYNGGTARFTGQIVDMQWWNLELTAADVLDLSEGKQLSKNGAVTQPLFAGQGDVS